MLEPHTTADLWDNALCRYHDFVGIDLNDADSDDLYQRLAKCNSYRDAARALCITAEAFKLYLDPLPTGVDAKIRGHCAVLCES